MNNTYQNISNMSMAATLFSVATILLSIPMMSHAMITSQLDVGSRGNQVSELQQFLGTNYHIYPGNIVTGYYGDMTQAAVVQYQLAYNISPVGAVGPVTRMSIANIQASGKGLDLTVPRFTMAPSLQVSNNSAIVTWGTSEASRGKVIYSTTPIVLRNMYDATGVGFVEPSIVNGMLAPFDDNMRLMQSVTINNLSPGTTYYYMVLVLDPSNNISITLPATFRTNS